MHSVVPHQHIDDLGDFDQGEAFEKAGGLLDYVKLLFLTDLGEGHMESFDQGEQFDFASEFQVEFNPEITPFSITLSPTNFVSIPSQVQTNYTDGVPILRQYFLSHIEFRGPPVQA